ncbi:MAG: hypothetical protein ACRD59_16385 [Candidatus Acidiferrales bacterium]
MFHGKFALLALLFLSAPAVASACACSKAPPGMCPGLQKDDVAFLGTVTSAETLSDANVAPATVVVRYHFRINERFAGDDTAEVDVFSGGEDGDCAFRFKDGEQYIVFPNRAEDGRLFATICNGTRLAAEGRALIPQLRAMRNGDRVASVFGVLRRSNPPMLAPPDDPDDPLPNIKLKLRSKDDRFATSTAGNGVYTFYDVHAGQYQFTANLPVRMELTQKTLNGPLPTFKIPNGACYEYNVDALPTGRIHGSVRGPDGNPLPNASVELYRAGAYEDSRPGLWGFQGPKGDFEFDHVGPGDYILVFNRMNRKDPNSPFRRSFYPDAPDPASATPIVLKDGQQLLKADVRLKEEDGYPTRQLRVKLKWKDGRPPGEVYVTAKTEDGENPAARKIEEGIYAFTLLESAKYTISAWEDLDPSRRNNRRGADEACEQPARLDSTAVVVDGADAEAKEITLTLAPPECQASPQ